MAFTSGQTVDFTLDPSKEVGRTGKASICGLMDKLTTVSSRGMIVTALVFYTTQMVSATKVLGKMVKSTARATIFGLMALSITVFMQTALRKKRVSSRVQPSPSIS